MSIHWYNIGYEVLQEGIQYVRVGQDTRLNNRVIDLRTPANQAIFRIQCQVSAVSIYSLYFLVSPIRRMFW